MHFSFFGCEFGLTFGFSSYLDVEIGHFSPGPFAAWKRQSEFTGGFFREIFQQVWSWVAEHEPSCQGFGKGRATARRRRRLGALTCPTLAGNFADRRGKGQDCRGNTAGVQTLLFRLL
jgi:hypothetical protein